MSYNSKYTGQEVEQLLDQVAGGGGSSVTVDAAISATSTNPVQNKVIKEYIDAQVGSINTILETIIAG